MSVQGIDVAKWQGTIDFEKVAKTKDFAILKVTDKSNAVEGSFEANYKKAIAAGLKVGVYRYVYAKTVAAATTEANAIVKALQGKNIVDGVWLDMEDSSIKAAGTSALKKVIETEAAILNKAGYGVGIYCNRDWYLNVLDGKTLSKTYPFWIARYPSNDNGTYNATSSLAPISYAKCWQYSSKGKVDGITGYVDLDVAYVDLSTLFAVARNYYPACKSSYVSIVKALASVGETDTSLAHRKAIAAVNDISNAGTVAGNNAMLALLKAGQLLKG